MTFRIAEIAIARRLLRLARHERRAILLVGLLGVASAIFEGMGLSLLIPLASYATSGELSAAIPVIGPALAWLQIRLDLSAIHIVLFVVGFIFLGILVGYLNLVISNIVAQRFGHGLRVRIFDTALSRQLFRVDGLASGAFVNNLASETWTVCDALFKVIGAAVQAVTGLVLLGFLALLSPFYTLVLLAMTALMALVVHLVTRKVRGIGAEAVAANEAFMAYVWDALGGLRVIRGFGREAYERIRFEERSRRVRTVFTQLGNLSGIVGPITQIMGIATVGTILGIAILRGDAISTLVGFLAIAYRMQPRVSSLLSTRTALRSVDASVEAIESALEGGGEARAPTTHAFAGLRRGVVIDGVTARYPNAERPALHSISCSFPFGQMTAVAGQSGAGKSTLVALLLRFIEPEKGRILIDNLPLTEIDPEGWHRRIAFVEQNAFLFNASIRENIGYGDLEADLEAIQEAARVAQADGFIEELPAGYDTVIGDGGAGLSQGQRQRIALARSLIRNPDVLILDEATNALDGPTERALRAAIEHGRQGRAVIVIAHRRETIEHADQVVVLENGRVVQAGAPEELSGMAGTYAQLYLDEVAAARQ